MSGYLIEAAAFLCTVALEMCILFLLLRFLLQMARTGLSNPLLQVLNRVTDPVLRPARRVVPSFGGVDWASITLMVLFAGLELGLVGLLTERPLPGPAGLALLAAVEILRKVIYIYFVMIIVHVLLQWLNPGAYSPIIMMLHELCSPLLSRIRRVVPPLAGLDFSPLVALIGLQLLTILLIKPLTALAHIF